MILLMTLLSLPQEDEYVTYETVFLGKHEQVTLNGVSYNARRMMPLGEKAWLVENKSETWIVAREVIGKGGSPVFFRKAVFVWKGKSSWTFTQFRGCLAYEVVCKRLGVEKLGSFMATRFVVGDATWWLVPGKGMVMVKMKEIPGLSSHQHWCGNVVCWTCGLDG